MLYEVSLKVVIANEVGEPKEVKEQYLVDDLLFASVEQRAMALYDNECDVFAIKRSRVREVIDKRESDEECIYEATVTRTTLDENTGIEKKVEYQVFLHSENLKGATEKILNYTKQSIDDEEVKSVKKTKFINLI